MENIKVSIVIPCLNEEKGIGACIDKIQKAMENKDTSYEIIIVDNGCTDNTCSVAVSKGARIVTENKKGYGSALRAGMDNCYGKYIIMADGDDTYNFLDINKFIEKLNEGYDLVMGNRFKGNMKKGAMSWSHRYIGNPILSSILKLFFHGKVGDSHCGLRAFTKKAYKQMNLKTTGMEFASEIVIHTLKEKMKIFEIPIDYYPRIGESKLNSIRDAWRHMRFMLLYSPNYLFILPGLFLFLLGAIITLSIAIKGAFILGRNWQIHAMIISSVMTITGWQILSLGFVAKSYVTKIGLDKNSFIKNITKKLSLEILIALGTLFILIGFIIFAKIIYVWYLKDFGALSQMKPGLAALVFTAIGTETIFIAFLLETLQLRYRN